jgi:hypothetical protein
VNEPPPADILRRLRPIPTYGSHPTTVPHDLSGVDPEGGACSVALIDSQVPALVLFLSSNCLGCLDMWHGTGELADLLPADVRIVLVSRGPEREDAAAIAALASVAVGGDLGVPTVMSTQAFTDYRVVGAPFMVVVEGNTVRTEGVPWGIPEVARTVRAALGRAPA